MTVYVKRPFYTGGRHFKLGEAFRVIQNRDHTGKWMRVNTLDNHSHYLVPIEAMTTIFTKIGD
jgi:hypothetical protein